MVLWMTENDLINLGNRVIDKQGNIVYFNDSLIELMYNDIIPSDVLYPDNDCDVKAFNKFSYENFDDVYYQLPNKIKTIEERKNNWFYPKEFDELPLDVFFNELVKNKPQVYKDRVNFELQLYKEKSMEKFLRFCIYFSTIIAENDLVIGVGRGSSVSSLLLYELKIHLIDPIKYDLDIREFLK